MRYNSHFASSRRFNYALRTTVGGGHNVYFVDYVVDKDSIYRIVTGYDYSLGSYLVQYDYDSGSLYNVKYAGDYTR